MERRVRILLLAVLVVLVFSIAAAWADDPSVWFTVTPYDTGFWDYSFHINNLSSAYINDFSLEPNFSIVAGTVATPSDWTLFAHDYTSPDAFVQWLTTDEAGVVGAIAPGNPNFTGFGFRGTSYSTAIPFFMNGEYFTGTAVPEPGTLTAALMLLTPGGLSLAWRLRKRRER